MATDQLPMWTVYNSPKDFPGRTVARLWHSFPKPTPMATIMVGTLEELRANLEQMGLVNIGRQPGDDPCIVEVWL